MTRPSSPVMALAWLPLVGAVAFASAAEAGFTVQQKILHAGDKATAGTAELNWRVTDKEFRVDVKKAGETRHFVFNGRVFYVCGKLGKEQLDYVRKLDVKDKDLLASLEKGACQELSADFATKFFLAPHDAVGAVAGSASIASNLSIDDAEIELSGSVGSVAGVKCVNYDRSFSLVDRKKKDATLDYEEKSCNAPTVKWRTAFGRQLGMTMIRQPNGKDSFKTLQADLKKMPGLALTATTTVSGKDVSGKPISRTVTLATSSVKEGEIAAKELGFPSGFEPLDQENLAALVTTKKKPVAGKGGPTSGELDVGDVLRVLLIGGNPAAAVLGGGGE